MRHARLALLAPLALFLNGCWLDDQPYHELRVNNRTDQTVNVQYVAVVNVVHTTDENGDWYYEYDYADRSTYIEAGEHQTLWVPITSTVEIDVTYNNIIQRFTDSASSWVSREVSIDITIEDFMPAVPAANG